MGKSSYESLQRNKARREVRATDLFKEVDGLMREIEIFYAKNPVIWDQTLNSFIKKIHDSFEEDEETMTKARDEAKMRAITKIDNLHEARLLRRKIQAIREEHAILSKSELWPKR